MHRQNTNSPTFKRKQLLFCVLDEITGTFENLPALSEIELSKNNLVSFDMQILPRSLTYLGLSGNLIAKLENTDNLHGMINLEDITLSYNKLSGAFDVAVLPESLQLLNLESNEIEVLANPSKLLQLSNLKRLTLSENHLKVLDAQYLPSSLRQLLAVGNNLTSFDLKAMEQLDLGDSELIFSVDGT